MGLFAVFQFTTLFVIGDVVCSSLVLKSQKIEPVVILKDLSGGHNVVGKKIELECQTTFYSKYVSIEWKTPKNVYKNVNLRETTNSNYVTISTLVVNEAEAHHSGLYICEIIYKQLNYTLAIKKMLIRVYGEEDNVIEINDNFQNIVDKTHAEVEIQIRAHPYVTVDWFKNSSELIKNSSNIRVSLIQTASDEEYNYKAKLTFNYITFHDQGLYTIVAKNGINKSSTLVEVYLPEKNNVNLNFVTTNEEEMTAVYQCRALGNSKPKVNWIFQPCDIFVCLNYSPGKPFSGKPIVLQDSHYEDQGLQVVSYVAVNLTKTGILKCVTQNSEAVETVFHLHNQFECFVENKENSTDNRLDVEYRQIVNILCLHSLYKYTSHFFWYHNIKMINKRRTPYFRIHTDKFLDTALDQLNFDFIIEDQLGNFTCQVVTRTGDVESKTIEVVSKKMSSLIQKISFQDLNGGHTTVGQDIRLVCNVTSYRHEEIKWMVVQTKLKEKFFTWTNAVRLETLIDNQKISKEHVKTVVNSNVYITTNYLTISQANISETGYYSCWINDEMSRYYKFMWLQIYDAKETRLSFEKEIKFDMKDMNIKVFITAHPLPKIKWFNNHGKEIFFEEPEFSNFHLSFNQILERRENVANYEITFSFSSIDTKDFRNYTIVVENNYGKINYSIKVNVTGTPTVKMDIHKISTKSVTFKCSSTTYPKSTIDFFFKKCTTLSCCLSFGFPHPQHRIKLNQSRNEDNGLQNISYASVNLSERGFIVCRSSNSFGDNYAYEPLLGSDSGVEMSFQNADYSHSEVNKSLEIIGKKYFKLICAGSKFKYMDKFITSKMSYLASSSVINVPISSSMFYKGYRSPSQWRWDDFLYFSFFPYKPILVESPSNNYYSCNFLEDGFLKSQTFHIESRLSAYVNISKTNMADNSVQVDLTSKWKFYCYPEGFPTPVLKWYKNDKVILPSDKFKFTNDEQVLEIDNVVPEDEGVYKCEASNNYGVMAGYSSLNVVITNTWFYVQIILLLCALGFIAILAFMKFQKSRKIHKKLKSFGLIYSQEINLSRLNPELSIEDQALLLPFSQKWEIPFRSIILGKQLGKGAFGVTFQATIVSYFPDDPMKTVAVKTVNPSSGFDCIKALVPELKILSHLGSHVNIVNFLGACTQRLLKDELYLVLEFCSFGSLLDHIKRHSENFIDQKDYESDEFNWSSDGVEDVEDTKNKSSFSSKNFLVWSFQIARGMEYLNSRNVVHGDLAARNVLLTDENVVKVCDFGLAKNVYNYGKYVKKSQGPLPIKWMAIETIDKGIFSTQSDVWSFGIVLWEIFSLGKTPYFSETVDENFCERLIDGHRMEQPSTATRKIYKLMLDCWQRDPSVRPSFTDLSEQIGSLLDDPVKNYYISMNNGYILMNKERFDKDLDYLTMVNEPTYQNIMSKSVSHE